MPITTYISQRPLLPNHKELCELLVEVRTKTGEEWVVLEHFVPAGFWKRLFNPVAGTKLYELLVQFDGSGIEYQIINFYSSTSGTSINTFVPVEYLVAYLLGMLGGMNKLGRT